MPLLSTADQQATSILIILFLTDKLHKEEKKKLSVLVEVPKTVQSYLKKIIADS